MDTAILDIDNEVIWVEVMLVITVVLVVLIALLSGRSLLHSMTAPIEQIVSKLRLLATGDLSARLDLGRNDEFASIEQGFTRR